MKVGLALFKQADCLSSRRNVQIIASAELTNEGAFTECNLYLVRGRNE